MAPVAGFGKARQWLSDNDPQDHRYVELYSWILGWGEKVEVLEPVEIRGKIVKTAKAILNVYKENKDL